MLLVVLFNTSLVQHTKTKRNPEREIPAHHQRSEQYKEIKSSIFEERALPPMKITVSHPA